MKFSYSLIKKFAPGKYTKTDLIRGLNTYSFEAVDLGGDIFEVSNTAISRRFSSAASHLGVARETSVIFNTKFIDPTAKKSDFSARGGSAFGGKDKGVFGVNVKEKKLCPRYSATYVTNVKVGPSPDWLRNVLEICGLRSINNVVDIMNYVMLETGQPLHAFDADRVVGGLIVRRAKVGEVIETIDGGHFKLDNTDLVIADEERALAIAGIKGGKYGEVSLKTTRLLVESANFEGVNVYKSSRRLNLATDASVIFSHNLSPELAELGMRRALSLLKELCNAKIYKTEDIYPKKQPKKVIKFDLVKIERVIGLSIKKSEAEKILIKLGFSILKNQVSVPALRTDIEIIEDLAEEIARFGNYNELPAESPVIAMGVGVEDELVLVKEKIRKYLSSVGYSEVYNYSFVSQDKLKLVPVGVLFGPPVGGEKAVGLINPLSSDFSHLRNSLAPNLVKNIDDNLRFFREVRIFEIGKIFGDTSKKNNELNVLEKPVLAIAISAKNGFFELKGVVDGLFGYLGLVDWFMPDLNYDCGLLETSGAVRIESGNHNVLGYMGIVRGVSDEAVLELDLEKLLKEIIEEKEYEPLSKFPSVDRDISILVPREVRIGRVLELIQGADVKHVDDVDLMDYFEDDKFGDQKSLTFRIVFRADDRSLTNEEVDKELQKIIKILMEEVDAEIR